jgi:hypothetical protein
LDEFLLIGLFILVFIGIPVGIGLLLYFVPKRFGYPKTGKYITIIFGLLVLTVVVMTVFEDDLFTKNDAKELIREQQIILNDNFSLEHNESMWAIGDYYHTFTLVISETDKTNAIIEIKKSENFKLVGEPISDLYFDSEDRYNGSSQTQNYETDKSFVREFFEPNGDGYAPTYRRITIDKNKNEIVFEDIDY